ncbi:MAG: 1-acyl-sn-glycerol-3-phosphate acyltransferase [Cellvibrionaceae bacterium]
MADRNQAFYESIPRGMPRTCHPLLTRFGKFVLNLIGWRFLGVVPDIGKAVIILAPHTSNWDFFIACIAKFALDLKASYIMKQEAFFWPFKSWLMDIGGIPIDRRQPVRIVAQVAKRYREQNSLWLVITPEGTRKKVTKYKTGFVRIAHSAQVPIVVVGFDYQKKAIIFSKVVQPSGNHEQDADALYHYCREAFTGRHPEYQ